MKKSCEQSSFIGIDLGGTKLLIGEMDRQGRVLRSMREPTGSLDQENACALIISALKAFMQESAPGYVPCAIGVGLAGHVDSQSGKWLEIDPTKKKPISIADEISARFGLPCFVDNDVKSAAKAELLFGYGRQSEDFVYINVGTGIAAGIITGGRLLRGGHFNAGEVGHTSSGLCLHQPCICGREDCVELITSGSGLDQCARRLSPEYPDTALCIPETGRVNALDIFKGYDKDPLCRVLTDNAAKSLANLIMNLVRFCDPDAIVLGGGVVSDGILLSHVQQYLNPHTMRFVTNGVHLTQLDSHYAGLIGACANAILGIEDQAEQTIPTAMND